MAVGVINGDGLADVYFCGLQTDNKLFRNLGDWKFEDMTRDSGSLVKAVLIEALIEDIDGDSDNDLLVTPWPRNLGFSMTEMGGSRKIQTRDSFRNLEPHRWPLPIMISMGTWICTWPNIELRITRIALESTYPLRKRAVILVSPSSRFTYLKTSRTDSVNIVELGGLIFYENLGGGKLQAGCLDKRAFLDADGRPLAKPPLDWGLSVSA